MYAEKQEKYLSLLHDETSLALGCTEPGAVALAAAYAAAVLEEEVQKIKIIVSSYILKNGMNVGIPGTGMSGFSIAAAMGSIGKNPEKGLMVLNGISDIERQKAKEMVKKNIISIDLAETEEKVYVEAQVTSKNHYARAVIKENHQNLVLLERDRKKIFERKAEELYEKNSQKNLENYDMTLKEIVNFVKSVPEEELKFLEQILQTNQAIAREGMRGNYGLKVGYSMLHGQKTGLIGGDIATYASAMAAAAADARMSGCELPVVSTAGSGNQGITATVPIIEIGEKLGIKQDKIRRAAALSILFTIHTKQYLGRLSVLCGCSIAAAMGVGCGIIFMKDGTYEQMCHTVSTMVADISGVVCDGAKPGCALKIATAVESAVRAANMALNGKGAGGQDGIVCEDVEATLSNLGILGNIGMKNTNRMILKMMLQKQKI